MTERRRYDSPVRRQQVAETRDRIVAAGSALVHELPSWDWRELTFRAVAERAGVGERTVYRHFPTERHLHDAVMQRPEEEAGVVYEGLTLDALPTVTARVFASLPAFAARETVPTPRRRGRPTSRRRRRRCSTSSGTCRPTSAWWGRGGSTPTARRAPSCGCSIAS